MPSKLASLAVVSLLLLSGCGGILGNETPTPPRENRTNDSPKWLAPGLTSDGVTDAHALASTHRETVMSQSRTAAMETRLTDAENGSVFSNRSYVVRTTEDDRRLAEWTEHSTNPRFSAFDGSQVFWHDPDVSEFAARSETEEGIVRYDYREETPNGLFPDAAYAGRLYSLFSVMNVSIAPETVDRSVHRLEATEQTLFFEGREIRNVTFTARVDYTGVVRSYEFGYETDVDGTLLRVTERIRVSDIGSTSIERPEWVETAREAQAERDGSTDESENGT
ncbi:hypothetical protein AUR64_15185 [Haloprofundus marisrubri]|uniref:Uncharacterized protein n=1 Tax=Haloprofundus marisrubri TaxID=1514971 RepID=A0A0W1R7N9_9EURY|nr:hypothetical protein [Haloprofundus marisrubri]KTG09138.1 hypothetical protein AUR64_15185 [Haloprofundus marisrubri]